MTTWRDRVKKGYYTEPSGTRHQFDVERVSSETELANTPFTFPGVDGAYVQQNEPGGRMLPILAFFSGPQHDLQAKIFEEACCKKGIGRLEHPFYGTFDVVPVGRVARRDNLAQEANQSVVEVVFWKTLRAAYPSQETDPAGALDAAITAYKAACATQFADATDLTTLTDAALMRSPVTSMCAACNDAMGATTRLDLEVSQDFQDSLSAIVDSIDTALTDPESLAMDLADLVLLPAQAVETEINEALAAWVDLANAIMGSEEGTPSLGLSPSVLLDDRARAVVNAFYGADAMALNCVAGAVAGCLNATFSSRPQAIEAAETVLDLFDTVVAWRDAAYDNVSAVGAQHVDTGAAYQALHNAVSLMAGYLVEVSFTLVPERSLVLGRARTFIDLSKELYGSVEDKYLNAIINNNALTGDEILEIPAGREIKYYPQAA